MLLFGIGFTLYGVFGASLVAIFTNNFNHMPDEFELLLAMDIISLFVGIVLIIAAIMKSRNRDALDKIVNREKNILEHSVCRKCGLNLSKNVKVCPKCGMHTNFIQK